MINLYEILSNFGFMETAVGFVVGSTSKDFLYSVADLLLVPILQLFMNLKNIESWKIHLSSSSVLSIGIILINFIRFSLIIVTLVLLLQYIIYPVTEKMIKIKHKNNNKIIEKLDECCTKLDTIDKSLHNLKKHTAYDIFESGKINA